MKDIIVFGANGMLGRYVSRFFEEKNFNVIKITRKDYDLSTITNDDLKNLIIHYDFPIVINCAGAIIQKYNRYGAEKMIQINSVFPWKLSSVCNELGIKLIHITTDCVYSGLRGHYIEDDRHDPIDVYGKSKSLGEPDYGTIIRTSIIGEEIGGGVSFVEWVKSEKGKTVNGYMRNIWNGITCLEFAKICYKIIENNLYWNGIRHIHSPDIIVKSNMIRLVSEIYNLNVNVEDKQLPVALCDRTILSKYDLSQWEIPSLRDQIIEMKNFKL